MKKILVPILAFFYLATSTGATVHMHYCMGKLANSSLMHDDDATCSKCGMKKDNEKSNGCCKDEQKFIKNDKDQKNATSIVFEFNLGIQDCTNTAIPLVNIASQPLIEEYPVSNAPPRTGKTAIYIQKRTFLI